MIDINNLTKFKIDGKSFSQVAKKVLSGENKETETLSLVFVNPKEIKDLNKKFRNKNKETDVLSFNLDEDGYLGEIVICPKVVKDNAKKDRVPYKYEIMKVYVHGILHLLGYDHEKTEKEALIMEGKQEEYLKTIKI